MVEVTIYKILKFFILNPILSAPKFIIKISQFEFLAISEKKNKELKSLSS